MIRSIGSVPYRANNYNLVSNNYQKPAKTEIKTDTPLQIPPPSDISFKGYRFVVDKDFESFRGKPECRRFLFPLYLDTYLPFNKFNELCEKEGVNLSLGFKVNKKDNNAYYLHYVVQPKGQSKTSRIDIRLCSKDAVGSISEDKLYEKIEKGMVDAIAKAKSGKK